MPRGRRDFAMAGGNASRLAVRPQRPLFQHPLGRDQSHYCPCRTSRRSIRTFHRTARYSCAEGSPRRLGGPGIGIGRKPRVGRAVEIVPYPSASKRALASWQPVSSHADRAVSRLGDATEPRATMYMIPTSPVASPPWHFAPCSPAGAEDCRTGRISTAVCVSKPAEPGYWY